MIKKVDSSTLVPLLVSLLMCAQLVHAQVPPDMNDVVARVDGEEITRGELEAKLSSFRGQALAAGFADPLEDGSFPSRILQALVDQVLLTQYAREKGYSVTEAEIDLVQTEAIKRLPEITSLEEALAKSGNSLAGFRRGLARDLFFDKVVEQEIVPAIEISEEAKKEFLANNQQLFQLSDRVRIRHVFKMFGSDATEADRDAARKAIAELDQQLREGANLADLAREHSDNKVTAKNGGETPWIDLSADTMLVKKLRELTVGQRATVIESELGVHLAEVLVFQPARAHTLEEAGPQIEGILKNQAIKDEVGKLVDQVRQQAKVETFL